ncbi:alpha-1,2-fucosyltransferase [Dysgonomonas sp. 216]|uniref:alpha-1,2-fucosyltransferase n=1 Tax=Dysgonomonas sp. 216 TaxID=2302934 RepID=UPI0013D1DFF3|nr:alpha-1,2-fucosyltransferase [Dysgonomonas sp. 216]NDW18397.1 alpha-1,2-fucosyltransferase [Dysgonomonas sp. 216]
MVSLLLTGGLGNQMFQYAAARALSIKLNTDVSIDLYSFKKETHATYRRYELDIFAMSVETKSPVFNKMVYKAIPFLLRSEGGKKIVKKLNVFHDLNHAAIAYDTEFENLSGNVLMMGYFQNERYFDGIKDVLLSDFRFREELNDKNKSLALKIADTNSVSVHVRRGDYLTPHVGNLNLLDKGYYSEAINTIKEKIINPEFVVFSDDIEWVRQNLDLPSGNVTFVDWNKGTDSYKDMQLMSLCKHNIIANSSFSWWGAWLNRNPEKMVVAPKQWYKVSDANLLIDGFIPKSWSKI